MYEVIENNLIWKSIKVTGKTCPNCFGMDIVGVHHIEPDIKPDDKPVYYQCNDCDTGWNDG